MHMFQLDKQTQNNYFSTYKDVVKPLFGHNRQMFIFTLYGIVIGNDISIVILRKHRKYVTYIGIGYMTKII